MDAIARCVVQRLISLASEEFKLMSNVKHDLNKMKDTVEAIRAILKDAEEMANNNNHEVSLWLAKLKDVVYDADDLLDDLSTEALRRRIMSGTKVAKEVRIFFSRSNQLVYDHRMVHKLRELRETLDETYKVKNQLRFTDQPFRSLPVLEERKQTYSFVQEKEFIGREEEKDRILSYLLESDVKSSVSIIPIVGFGGLGKTAFAQLVYNHVGVRNYFELRKWVCVSDIFDVKQIAQKILGQGSSNEMEQVQQDIRKLLEGKKFLIVLDDVWNEDDGLWCELKSLLANGAYGSMIIVTTRNELVGKMMGTHDPIILKGLDDERSWELFCKMAFGEGGEPNDKELLEILREVAKKCGGIPLAIRAVGSLVKGERLKGNTNLSYLSNCELWNVGKSLEDRVFPVLKLSYVHLPLPVKNCFAYCSLFSKDFEFKKQTLIHMWVAEGFIELSNQSRCEEDVGHEYFMNLLSRCFFQDITTDLNGNIETCKMHDLIHDLAQFVANHEYLVIRGGKKEPTRDTTRHCSIERLDICSEILGSFNFDKLRTLLFNHFFYGFKDDSIFYLVASKLKCLRVLKLDAGYIDKIPKNIDNLKHIRFLDLSRNRIRHLPKAVTRLLNLQTLDISRNYYIRELPRDISKLVSLRHLLLSHCYDLGWMPKGLGQLTCLQTLPLFVVDSKEMQETRGSAGISELGELNNLRGSLAITQLRNLRSNPQEAESAKLHEKQNLEHLELKWDPAKYNIPFCPHAIVDDELILERLRPHHTIKSLLIDRFCGEKLPEWIASLMELQHLALHCCQHLKSLPQGLPNLTSLRTVDCPLLPNDERRKIDHNPPMDPHSMFKMRRK